MLVEKLSDLKMFSLVEGSAYNRQRLCFKFSRCSLTEPRHNDACTIQCTVLFRVSSSLVHVS